MIPRKQAANQEQWLEALENISKVITKKQIDALVSITVRDIQNVTKGKKAAYCWSGGKDSIALEFVTRKAGVKEGVLVISKPLEYPAFLKWVEKNKPPGLEIVDRGLGLDWLAEHPKMLFPQDGKTAAKWFKLIQHKGQAQYFKKHGLDMLLLGRRTADGNYTGPKGKNIYTNTQGVTRYSPLAGWSHEQVFALFHYYKLELPPFYFWPNGFKVGTGVWPARQWTGSIENGWAEVYANDPGVIRGAARVIPSAADFLKNRQK